MQTELFIDQNIPLKKSILDIALIWGDFLYKSYQLKLVRVGWTFFLVAMLKTTLFYDKEVEINWSENKIAIF